MAIYCRNSGSLSSMLIFCCSNYIRVAPKFHVQWQEAAQRFREPRRAYHLTIRNHTKNSHDVARSRLNDKSESPQNSIVKKKMIAERSILVHVKSKRHIPELQYICNTYGQIQEMYHYQTEENHDFVLIEFQNSSALAAARKHVSSRSDFSMSSWIFNLHPSKDGGNTQNVKKTILVPHVKRTEAKVRDELKKLGEQRKSVSEKIQAHYELTRLSPIEEKLRYFIVTQIEKTLSILNPQLKVWPFGSTVNGFGRYNSDLDLALLVDQPQNTRKNVSRPYLSFDGWHIDDKGNNRAQVRASLQVVAQVIPLTIPGIRHMCEILSARVPIIKFKHWHTDLSCDLTVNQRDGICMSELLFIFGEFDRRVRPLALFIRDWARNRKITSIHPGPSISNFGLSLLLIFYLQTVKMLPSLKVLTGYARYCDAMLGDEGRRYSFLRKPQLLPSKCLTPSNANLETLLLGFFDYYSSFNFDKHSVCIHTGQALDHPNNRLYITNPLDVTLNVSKNVSLGKLNELRKQFQESARIMRATENNSVFEDLLLIGSNDSQSPNETVIRQSATNLQVLESMKLEDDVQTDHVNQVDTLKESECL